MIYSELSDYHFILIVHAVEGPPPELISFQVAWKAKFQSLRISFTAHIVILPQKELSTAL